MRVEQFQKLNILFESTDDQVVQLASMICEYFQFNETRVDAFTPKEFIKYSKKIEKVFAAAQKHPLFHKAIIETDAKKITLGQFIELQHWLKSSETASLHLICASILFKRTTHEADAKLVLGLDIRKVVLDVRTFLLSFYDLVNAYKNLFEIEQPTDGEDEEVSNEPMHPFLEQYGWIYSAKKVADYEGLKLSEAYELPILQALNDLAYLKSEQHYNKKING